MGLPVIFSKTISVVKSAAGSGALLAKKHAPEIMIGCGIAGFVVTIVETVKATNRTNEILDKRDTALFASENEQEDKVIRKGAKKSLIFAWLPVVTTGIASALCVMKGYRIINGRYVATAAAYKSLEAFTDRYRGNVIDEFGREVDWRMAHGIKPEDWEKAEEERRENALIKENNKLKKENKPLKSQYRELYSFRFDEYSNYFKRYWTPQQFLDYIKYKTKELQDKLEIDGYLFLNDVLEAFGLEKIPEGQLLGWVKRKGATPIVSVGYDEAPEEEIRRILGTRRNEELYFYLTPNYQGIIYNLIDSISRRDGYLIE